MTKTKNQIIFNFIIDIISIMYITLISLITLGVTIIMNSNWYIALNNLLFLKIVIGLFITYSVMIIVYTRVMQQVIDDFNKELKRLKYVSKTKPKQR